MKKNTLFTVALLLISLDIFATFLPNSDLKIERSSKASDIELEERYRPLVKNILELFDQEVISQNANMVFKFDFSSKTVNAFAKRSGINNENWHITFLGGLMRHPALNENIFSAILCHELGHHLGGTPRKSNDHWATVEGQSDYFAANICLKRLLRESSILVPNVSNIPNTVKHHCSLNFPEPELQKICLQTSSVSIDIGKFIYKLKQTRRGRRGKKPSINSRDNTVVKMTLIQHPNAQCRLDTFFEGALCRDGLNNILHGNLNCPDQKIRYHGSRPWCWFAVK